MAAKLGEEERASRDETGRKAIDVELAKRGGAVERGRRCGAAGIDRGPAREMVGG